MGGHWNGSGSECWETSAASTQIHQSCSTVSYTKPSIMDSSFLYSKEFFSVWICSVIFWLSDDHEHTSKLPFVETELMWFAYDSGFICNELVRIVREFKNKSYFSYFEVNIQI